MPEYNPDDFRRATQTEVDAARADRGHALFACKCGKVGWSAKAIAMSSDGEYNGARNIFWFNWTEPESSCPASDLYHGVAKE